MSVFEFAPVVEERIGGVLTISPTGIPSAEALGSASLLAPDLKLVAVAADVNLQQNDQVSFAPAVWKTVCVTSDGTIHSVYRRPESLVHAYSSDGGDNWTHQAVLMSDMAAAHEFLWDLDTDGAKLHLIYRQRDKTLAGTQYVKRVETVGFTWQSPVTIQTLLSDTTRRVGLWVFSTDRHYTWSYSKFTGAGSDPANNQIRYALNGGSVETVREVAKTTEELLHPAIVVDEQGNPIVFWFVFDNTPTNRDRWDYSKKSGGVWGAPGVLASSASSGAGGFLNGGLSLMPLASVSVKAAYDKTAQIGAGDVVYVRTFDGSAWDGEGPPITLPGDGIGGATNPSLYSGVDRLAYLGQTADTSVRATAWSVFDSLKFTSAEHYAVADTGQSSVLTSGSPLTKAFRMTPKRSTATYMVGTLLEDSVAGRKIWLMMIPKDY